MYTVKDLIKKLSTMDPDAWVVAGDRTFEMVDTVSEDVVHPSQSKRYSNGLEFGDKVVRLHT